MKITLDIQTGSLSRNAFLRAALRGLVSVTDEGEALIASLESATAVERTPAVVAEIVREHNGNISAAARELGVARSTVRLAMRSFVPVCPACEERPGVVDGYCEGCNAELAAHYDERRGGNEWTP